MFASSEYAFSKGLVVVLFQAQDVTLYFQGVSKSIIVFIVSQTFVTYIVNCF